MPQKLQRIAFQNVFSRLSLHEGVVAGIGVLLFFLGLWSGTLLTKLFSFAITGVAGFYLFDSIREKMQGENEGGHDDDHEESSGLVSEQSVMEAPPSDEQEEEKIDWEKAFVPERTEPEKEEEPQHEVRFDEPAERPQQAMTFSPSDFVDDEQSSSAGGHGEPKNEFNSLLQKVLAVVKEVMFAHTVSFYWVNREAQQLVLEGKLTDSGSFSTARKISIANDIVSQVAISGKPEVVTNIASNAERDIVPYYTSLQEIKSFVSVPVFYPRAGDHQLPVAVLAVDSTADDAYGQESILLLAKFTKMLSAVLKSSTEKYDLLSESDILKTENRFRLKAFEGAEVSDIGNALAEEASSLVPWDAMTLTLFDEGQKQWVVANVRTRHNHRYVVAKQVLDFHASIVGKTIKNNAVQDIADLSKTNEPRFLLNEASLGIARVGSFAAIPVSSANKCYGALTLECREKNAYGAKEIASVSNLASVAGIALELHEANEIIKEFVVVDESTGAVSKKYLLQRLAEELQRADDDGVDVSFLLFSLSSLADITGRYGKAGADAAVARVASILRSSVRSYDTIGRYDQSMFGVILVKTPSKDAYLWAEKLRSAIASSVVTFEQKTFSVSATVGICGATEGMTAEECVGNAGQVLEKAKEAGGNIVRVF
ncbi:MAG TPA: diguanylate cyclase [Bacteroidota bacterium]|nr:diguanylate cyclase [Bacteroidota bacterium]